jgi:hypothetical protein
MNDPMRGDVLARTLALSWCVGSRFRSLITMRGLVVAALLGAIVVQAPTTSVDGVRMILDDEDGDDVSQEIGRRLAGETARSRRRRRSDEAVAQQDK